MTLAGFPRISVDPQVCGGRTVVAGTRVRVSDVLEMLASGATPAEIAADYPYLTDDDVRAVLAYAAAQADHGGARRLMKFFVGGQLPPGLCGRLRERGHEFNTVPGTPAEVRWLDAKSRANRSIEHWRSAEQRCIIKALQSNIS